MYLCMAYRCSNMDLVVIMGGKYGEKKKKYNSLLPPPFGSLSGFHLVIFI